MRRGALFVTVGMLAIAMVGIAAPTVAQSPSEPAPATQGALTPVSVQLDFYPGTEYAPLQRGIAKGYFAEQGIDLTIEPSTGSLDTLNSINSNKVQFAFVDSTTYTLQRIQDTSDTTGVYAYYTHPSFAIWSSKPLNSAADMAGTTFGTVPFSAGTYELPFLLHANGVDPNSVTVNLMDFSVLYATLDSGGIDSAEIGYPGDEDEMIRAQTQGLQRYLIPSADWGLKEYAKLLIARDDAISSDPDLVHRLISAIDKSWTDALANATDQEIIDATTILDPQSTPDVTVATWNDMKKIQTDRPGFMNDDVFQASIDLATSSQSLTTDLKPSDLYTNEFIPGTPPSASPAASEPAGSGSTGSGSLNSLLPDEIKQAGTINVLTAPVFAPISFLPEGKSDPADILGSDPDILRAMGDKLGVTITFVPVEFPEMLTGVQSGRGDLAGGGLTDTAEREQTVSFVDDFQVGMDYVVKAGNAPGISTDYLSACGHTVAFTTGALSATQVEDLSAACVAAGKPAAEGVNVSDVNDTLLAVRSGRAEVSFWDDFGSFDTVNQGANNELQAFKIDGFPNQYWGFAVSKDDTQLQNALLAALQAVVADGGYDAILANYGLANNSLHEPGINLETQVNGQ
jgi:polar amino acid transport system substrate-binding protein